MVNQQMEDRFLAWLMTPKERREPEFQKDLAAELGIAPQELVKLKRDPEFLERWNTMYLKTISSPEVKSSIMNALLSIARDPDDPKIVQAAKAYFEIEGSLRPAKQQVDIKVQTQAVSDLSDEELKRLLAAKADDELAKRREAS